MAKSGINLLPNTVKFQLGKLRTLKKIKGVCLTVLTVIAFIGLLTKAVGVWFGSRVKRLDKELLSASSDLKQLEEKIGLQEGLRSRLKLTAGVLKKRVRVGSELAEIESLLPKETVIDRAEFSGSKWAIEAKIPDLITLDVLEKKCFSLKSTFKEVNLKGISRDVSGGWRFSLEIIR